MSNPWDLSEGDRVVSTGEIRHFHFGDSSMTPAGERGTAGFVDTSSALLRIRFDDGSNIYLAGRRPKIRKLSPLELLAEQASNR